MCRRAVGSDKFTVDEGVLRIKEVKVADVVGTLELPSLMVAPPGRNPTVDSPASLRATPPSVALIQTIASKLDLSGIARYRPFQSGSTTIRGALCYAFSGGGDLETMCRMKSSTPSHQPWHT